MKVDFVRAQAVLLLDVHGDILGSLRCPLLLPWSPNLPSATWPDERALLRLDTLDSRCPDGMRDPGWPRAGLGYGATHTGDLSVPCGAGKRTSHSSGKKREGYRAGEIFSPCPPPEDAAQVPGSKVWGLGEFPEFRTDSSVQTPREKPSLRTVG